MSIRVTVTMIHLILPSPIVPGQTDNLIANLEWPPTVSPAFFIDEPEGQLLDRVESLVGHRQVAVQSKVNA